MLDFETTGLSAGYDRPTEIALALMQGSEVVETFQSLMNPGRSIPMDVQGLTGITNAMVRDAPSIAEVMREAAQFVGNRPLLAHNASFDRKFWSAELEALGVRARSDFACTMLVSRRIYPELSNHRLGTLGTHLRIPPNGRAHRAMADVHTTTGLYAHILRDIERKYGIRNPGHRLLREIQIRSKHVVPSFLRARAAGRV